MQLSGHILVTYLILLFGLTTVSRSAESDSLFEILSDLDEENNHTAEYLEQLTTNPLDLNAVSRSEMLSLPFLNHQQIDSVLLHRPYSKYSELKTIIGPETYKQIKKFIILK